MIVNLQPLWMKSPNRSARGGTSTVDLIIVHDTGGPVIGPALNHFMHGSGTGRASAGYIIDTDGQIVKIVRVSEAAWQAGTTYWHPRNGVNAASIGIEVVHRSCSYPAAQYASLITLLTALVQAYGIPRSRIIGRSDIGTNDSGRLGRKSGDPGSTFQWSKLEPQNLSPGIGRRVGVAPPPFPGSFLDQFPTGALRSGDNDTSRRFGGTVRSTVTGNPVQELQEALRRIGYSVGTPDGDYGQKTVWAVRMFQKHFHEMGLPENGRVDAATASAIWTLS
ncbi:MAG: N-acetylmuramoyl-L-alanine amidase [Planctomycetaceae bacterium]